MISSARVYIFGIQYQHSIWMSISDCDKLSGLMANLIKIGIPKLNLKNIQFFNIYENSISRCEIHINKIKYDGRRVLTKDDMSELRDLLKQQLSKISNLDFDQVLIINDEFTDAGTAGFITNGANNG